MKNPYRDADPSGSEPLEREDRARLRELLSDTAPGWPILGGACLFTAIALGTFVALREDPGAALLASSVFALIAIVTWVVAGLALRDARKIERDLHGGRKHVVFSRVVAKEETHKHFRLISDSRAFPVPVAEYLEADIGDQLELHLGPESGTVLRWWVAPSAAGDDGADAGPRGGSSVDRPTAQISTDSDR